MTIQDINKEIQAVRAICAQNELSQHTHLLDALCSYLETPLAIISVVGARTSGKCALANSLIEDEILPSKIFKLHPLYKVTHGGAQPKAILASGEIMPLRSAEDIGRFTKKDYDITVAVESENGIFKNSQIELRTGFDTEGNCPLLNSVLSDAIIICIKATSLFSLEDMAFIDGLKKMNRKNVLICITHINNINGKEIPNILKFINTKHLPYPIAFFSDEPLSEVHEAIQARYGIGNIREELESFISTGISYNERIVVITSMLSDLKESIVTELLEKKGKLEQQKERKYSTYLAKVAKRESMMLGWTDIRIEYEKREAKCTDTILAELVKAKGKISSRIQASVLSISSPKDWWEKVFPLTLKNEIDNLSANIDNQLQTQIIKDFNWLNHELQVRFHQTADSNGTVIGETNLDYDLDFNNLSFSNLRTARYISMAGGATLATTLFFIVGPVGAIASASCSILGDRYIHQAIAEQREKLKNAVANVLDDVFGKMSSMIPTRVSALYEEMAKGIAEKEQVWSSSNTIEDFTCDELDAIKRISETISKLQN